MSEHEVLEFWTRCREEFLETAEPLDKKRVLETPEPPGKKRAVQTSKDSSIPSLEDLQRQWDNDDRSTAPSTPDVKLHYPCS